MLVKLINAKDELRHVVKLMKDVKIRCAFVNDFDLPIGYHFGELSEYYEKLNFDYVPDETVINGYVWFENGSFIERNVEKNWQYWKLNSVPIIPTRLKQPKPKTDV